MLKLLDKSNLNFIHSLSIKNFRNQEFLNLQSIDSSVVLLGDNGCGKTSILEAISTFSNSKGFRGSKLSEMLKKDEEECLIKLDLKVSELITYELKTIFHKKKKNRRFFFNDNEIRSFQKFRKKIPMLWLTPYTDRIFTNYSSTRRNFFDGIISNFDTMHESRLKEYDKLLKQRSKLLKEDYYDENWMVSLEQSLAELSVSIACFRIEILSKIEDILLLPLSNFPRIKISFSNSLENQLLNRPAIEIEDELKKNYFFSRQIDRLLGGSQFGCQKSDLLFENLTTNMKAKMCSSGEQQAMLISIIIASSKALKKTTSLSPILLLDEVFIHLDEIRKNALMSEIEDLQSQAWITTTKKENFMLKKNFCYHDLYYKEINNR